MAFESKYSEIKTFLSISEDRFELHKVIDERFTSDDEVENILENTLQFIYTFSMFKHVRPFMKSVYKCIKDTLEINQLRVDDFGELLIKNALMRFIQEYINYAKISQKEQVLNFLAESLEKLDLQPMIINLGLMLKPMYEDQDYIDQIQKMEEVEVAYTLNSEIELEIKNEIDQWLGTQELKLDRQEELKNQLTEKYITLVGEHNLSPDSKTYKKLLTEVTEMLNMKLTMLSLMDSFDDESFDPVPIK